MVRSALWPALTAAMLLTWSGRPAMESLFPAPYARLEAGSLMTHPRASARAPRRDRTAPPAWLAQCGGDAATDSPIKATEAQQRGNNLIMTRYPSSGGPTVVGEWGIALYGQEARGSHPQSGVGLWPTSVVVGGGGAW